MSVLGITCKCNKTLTFVAVGMDCQGLEYVRLKINGQGVMVTGWLWL